ncbi:MAG: ComEC/Rec2 family competence protein [Candidatus Dojkabacteria bacterium]|nr:ComEC/Rec2 family competence protein [Candidatus Dojkabacteria bacterium]MDD4561418.1 ComEC/Rec2 family competence protein [Candidatus Dojkabacteria bacterium]
MFHRLKVVSERLYKRLRAVCRYILDYKLLFFSLLYIFTTFFSLNFLRNIEEGSAIGSIFWILLLVVLFLVVFLRLRNIFQENRGVSKREKRGKEILYFFVHLLIFALVVIGAHIRVSKATGEIKETGERVVCFTERKMGFEGYVTRDPIKKHRFQHLYVRLLQDLSLDGHTLEKDHGEILVKVENYEKFRVGQVCNFYGTLVEPENFDDFDYKSFLNNKGVFLILEDATYSCTDIERRRGGYGLRNKLVDVKEELVDRIDGILLEPQSSLLIGMLFGEERLFQEDFEKAVRISGASHLVSASGYSITIIVLIVNRVLFFLPKKIKILFGFITVWLFAIFSGFSTSIVRACIMNSLSLVALFWGRGNTINISLPFTAALFVFFQPLIILNAGFLLSISATLGLFYILPILLAVKKKVTKSFRFVESYLLPTMSCTLSTLPISLLTFKTFSIWAVPVNMLSLPVMEDVMLWGLLSMLLYNIHRPFSSFILFVIDLKLSYFEYIVRFVERFNFGVWDLLNSVETPFSLLFFLVLFFLVIYYYPVEHEKYNYYLKDK